MEKYSYPISKDYDLLFDLVEKGEWVLCFIENTPFVLGEIKKDICTCYLDECDAILFESAHLLYSSAYKSDFQSKYDMFIKCCKKLNAEFIIPTIK